MMKHKGSAKVFDNEESALNAIYGNEIQPGDIVVIRYEGPKGGPGMREMLTPTSIWLLFFSYLAGGWVEKSLPLSIDFFVLGVAYVGVMLLINSLMPLIEKKDDNQNTADKI